MREVRADDDQRLRAAPAGLENIRDGGGLNGSFRLHSGTVEDDAIRDVLTGGQDSDWYFARQNTTVLDSIIDRALNELLDGI